MGRGRSKRRKNRQKNQKQKQHNLANRNSKTSMKRRRRNNFEARLALDSIASKGHKTMYLRFATTLKTVFSSEGPLMMAHIKELLEKARITSFTILGVGKWDDDAIRARLKGLFEEKGWGWAWNHVVFPLKNESNSKFIARVIDAFGITHYADCERQYISPVVADNSLATVRMFLIKTASDDSNWKAVNRWFVKTCPKFYVPAELGEKADQILCTKTDEAWLS